MCFSCFESPCLCLSLLLSPLCLSPAPSALGPPHQSSHFLPSPSHPTTQQVEHWLLRTLLWPGSPCPDISMMCPAQALLPAGVTHPTPTLWPRLARVLGWLPVQLTSLLRSAVLSSLLAFPPALAAIASALLGACTVWGVPTSSPPPSPADMVGACALLICTGLSCELEQLAGILPGHHQGSRVPCVCLGCGKRPEVRLQTLAYMTAGATGLELWEPGSCGAGAALR